MAADLVYAGIRREDKNPWERRTPLLPGDVMRITRETGIRFVAQPSPGRVFPDEAYRQAGAEIDEDLRRCKVIFGIKEVPTDKLIPGCAYAFFAHVAKAQRYNMPMLRRVLDLGCTLIDYERFADERGRRLIFFGRHAGIAGMLDTLWAVGRRSALDGVEFDLGAVRRALEYYDFQHAREGLAAVSAGIRERGIPEPLRPFVVGFAGYGNVSKGAQEVLDLLPVREVRPEDLPELTARTPGASECIFKVVFEERHMVVPAEAGRPFDLQEYYKHPERYRPCFEQHLPKLSVLVNCVYWEERYPRLVTRDWLRRAFAGGARPRLMVIGDLSCDILGANECTLKCTTPGDPVFTYLPLEDRAEEGLTGHGVVVLAVDNLPAEIPADASEAFGRMLSPYVAAIVRADYDGPFESLGLAPEIKRAVIAHRGRLAPEYAYLTPHLPGG